MHPKFTAAVALAEALTRYRRTLNGDVTFALDDYLYTCDLPDYPRDDLAEQVVKTALAEHAAERIQGPNDEATLAAHLAHHDMVMAAHIAADAAVDALAAFDAAKRLKAGK